MKREQLIELLTGAGVEADEAARRADEHLDTEAQAETLTKSLAALEEISTRQAAAEQANAERIEAAHAAGEASLAEVIAPALDAFVEETRAQNDALAKGLTGSLELLNKMGAQLKRLEARLNERPAAPAPAPMAKSVDYIPAPGEQTTRTPAREELLKSLATTTPRDAEHASQLMRAVSLLESGADPQDISSRFTF
jgi:hypothetical protein